MRVFLTGATGFIGGHVLSTLLERGHEVTVLSRRGSKENLAGYKGIKVVEGEWLRLESWRNALLGQQVIINTVGIIRERKGASFEVVQTKTACSLFDTAKQAGVQKIIQISAMGADEKAQSRFHRSKREADQYLERSGVPHVILRPSFVYGSGAQSMTLFRQMAGWPLTPVAGDGRYKVQPLEITDLVRAIVQAVEQEEIKDIVVDVGGKDILTFDEMLDILASREGKKQGANKIHVPWWMMGIIARMTDMAGGQGPITSEELGMLRRGNYGDNDEFVRWFGFEPRGMKEGPI